MCNCQCNKPQPRGIPEMNLLDQLLIAGVLKQVKGKKDTFTTKDFQDRDVTFTIKRLPENWLIKGETNE